MQQLAEPLRDFLTTESGSTALLHAAAVTAVVWASSPLSDSFASLWTTQLSVRVGDGSASLGDRRPQFPFFLVIGLEVRREPAVGELTDPRPVTVPAIAAVGGIVLPAAISLAVAPGGEAADG